MVMSMGGRRDDSAPALGTLSPEHPSGLAASTEHPSTGRRIGLGIGLLLAAGGTAAALATEDPLHLRVALLAVCWAFVLAALLAGDRRADQVAAAAREAELRHTYELELEREVAARHAYEADLESRLRREAEDAVRGELTRLRGELTGLSQLQGELAGLGQFRTELAGLGELRNDLSRMRSELTEQLSGELLIERMVMRAQSVRGPATPAADTADSRTLGGTTDGRPAGRTGGWDVDRWAESRVVPAEPAPRPIASPPPVPPPASTASPVLAPAPSYDSSRYDDLLFGSGPEPEPSPSEEAPSWSGSTSYDASGYSTAYAAPPAVPPVAEPVPGSGREPSGHARLEQILADSGVPAPTGGRSRRRRYRDEDDDASGDDVLARVLGR